MDRRLFQIGEVALIDDGMTNDNRISSSLKYVCRWETAIKFRAANIRRINARIGGCLILMLEINQGRYGIEN